MLTPYLEAKITDPFIKTVMAEHNKKIPPIQSSDDVQVDVLCFGKVILHVLSQQSIPLQSVSGVEEYQKCLDRITGDHSADLKSLIMECLRLEPEDKSQRLRAVVVSEIADVINNVKEECRMKYTRDGMDPLSWLAEIKQISLPTHIQLKVST